jgi:hypothetical protein
MPKWGRGRPTHSGPREVLKPLESLPSVISRGNQPAGEHLVTRLIAVFGYVQAAGPTFAGAVPAKPRRSARTSRYLTDEG